MAFAVIGDSFIVRTKRFVQQEQHPARRYSYFGVSGMSTHRKFEVALRDLKRAEPQYVFLNLGGNDLRWDSDVYSVYSDIILAYDKILTECHTVKGVWIASIVERGRFPSWTGLTRTSFNKKRRLLNILLKEHFGKQYVDIQKSVKYPRHYESDIVHPKYGIGLKLFGDILVRCFRPFHKH